jgi:Leucine-rich repeat (LRR) protein
MNNFDNVGSLYTCDGGEIEIHDETAFDFNITGQHFKRHNNSDVEAVRFGFKEFKKFPKNIYKYFPNLQAIYLNYAEIEELHQSDLQPFPQLKFLDLYSNKIGELEEDLFKFNPELRFIWFSDKLYKIHPNVFDNLKNLTTLKLDDNLCIDKSTKDDRAETMMLIAELKTKCVNFPKPTVPPLPDLEELQVIF